MVNGLTLRDEITPEECRSCAAGKMSRAPFPTHEGRVQREVLGLIHSDLIGPIKPSTIGGKNYILTFIDDRTRRS